MKLFKIIKDGKSCHGGNQMWSMPNGKPGDWLEVKGDLEMCKNGIHLTDKPFMWYQFGCEMYEAEYDGEILWDRESHKCVVRKARLIKKVPHPTWWLTTTKFIEHDIPSVNWLKPDGKPKKEWKLYTAKTWDAARAAARDAARAAARAAAGAAAWDAARAAAGDAAGDAARAAAWAAAWAAAGDAAWDAAGDAAWDAAGDAAWDAAWAAALVARIKVCEDLKLDKKHIDHANARWEVWQKGYGLYCDVNGVLYVYGVER